MAHEIQGTRFIALQKPGWHNLGRTFEEKILIEDGVKEVAEGIVVEKLPIFSKFEHNGQRFDVKAIGEDGDQTFGIWRLPTKDDPVPRFFGVAKKDWEVRQFQEYADDLKALNDAFTLTTAGVLKQGRRIFASMCAEPFDVKLRTGLVDNIQNYFVVDISNQPGKAHALDYTPIRTQCFNTLSLGRSMASISIKLDHSANVAQGVQLVAEMAAAMNKKSEEVRALFESMANVDLTDDMIKRVLSKVYKVGKKPAKVRLLERMSSEDVAQLVEKGTGAIDAIQKAERDWNTKVEKIMKSREVVEELLHSGNSEFAADGTSLWALYNAITYHEDHREGRSSENYEESVLFGARATTKADAWSACRHELSKITSN